MTDPELLIQQVKPSAQALAVAVAREDRDTIARILQQLNQQELWAAVVILAANVDPDAPLVEVPPRPDVIDWVVVHRILDGDFSLAPSATEAERYAVCATWPSTGRSLTSLEKATGWNVYRYREAQKKREAAA